jgi:hypothetical protein
VVGPELVDGHERRPGVERVEDGFHQDDVRPALDERLHLLAVGVFQLVERDVAEGRVLHVGRDAARAVRGADGPAHEARAGGVQALGLVASPPGQLGALHVELAHQVLHLVVGHGDRRAGEGVGLDHVRLAVHQVLQVDVVDHLGPGQRQQVVVALEPVRGVEVFEALAAEVGFLELVLLDHRAHRAVQDQDARLHFVEQLRERREFACVAFCRRGAAAQAHT